MDRRRRACAEGDAHGLGQPEPLRPRHRRAARGRRVAARDEAARPQDRRRDHASRARKVRLPVRIDPLENPQPLIERVYSYVAYRVGDGVHAEDITSEVFERALRYRTRYDARRGSPISWLIGIARRAIADYMSSEHAHSSDIPELSVATVFEDQVALRLELREAVEKLPERDRELVALRYGSDPTARDI